MSYLTRQNSKRSSRSSSSSSSYKNNKFYAVDLEKLDSIRKKVREKTSKRRSSEDLMIRSIKLEPVSPPSNYSICSPFDNVRSNLFEKFQIKKSPIKSEEIDTDSDLPNNKPTQMSAELNNSSLQLIESGNIKQEAVTVKSEIGSIKLETHTAKEDSEFDNIKLGVDSFIEKLLGNVNKRLKLKKYKYKDQRKRTKTSKKTKIKPLVDKIPILKKTPKYKMKKFTSDYLNKFLDSITFSDEENSDKGESEQCLFLREQHMKRDIEICMNPILGTDVAKCSTPPPCSFSDVLVQESYLSRPAELPLVCPWPSVDRCPLSSQIESKNGSIYVIKPQKRVRNQDRVPLSDTKKRRKQDVVYEDPPQYITPMEYHHRMMEHRRYLEKNQWHHITLCQDYMSLYHGKPIKAIPKYIHQNRTRPNPYNYSTGSTNRELLSYLDSKVNMFSENVWRNIEDIAVQQSQPLHSFNSADIDYFFWRISVKTCVHQFQPYVLERRRQAAWKRQHDMRKHDLLHYFKPELYLTTPHHIYPPTQPNVYFRKYPKISQHTAPPVPNVVKDSVPNVPSIPAKYTPSKVEKSPELKNVENVYSYKKRNSVVNTNNDQNNGQNNDKNT